MTHPLIRNTATILCIFSVNRLPLGPQVPVAPRLSQGPCEILATPSPSPCQQPSFCLSPHRLHKRPEKGRTLCAWTRHYLRGKWIRLFRSCTGGCAALAQLGWPPACEGIRWDHSRRPGQGWAATSDAVIGNGCHEAEYCHFWILGWSET